MRITLEILIQLGQMFGYMRGAYKCATKIYQLVDSVVEIDEIVTDIKVTGLGL